MSLTGRVSLFFLGTLAVVLVGFSVGLYCLAGSYLRGQTDDRLNAALDVLEVAVDLKPTGPEWDADEDERHITIGLDHAIGAVRWLVLDGNGATVAHSKNVEPQSELFPVWRDDMETGVLTATDAMGNPWRIHVRRLGDDPPMASSPEGVSDATTPPNRHVLVLAAGVQTTPMQTTLGRLAMALFGFSVVLWLLAAVAGRWVCRRALAPLTAMAHSAHAIQATNLDERLPIPTANDELRELGMAFNDVLDRVQEAFERQRRFTGEASHQLRTPLTALLGQVEVALRRERGAEEYRVLLEKVGGQGNHLVKVVEMLLFLARADAESRFPASEYVDLETWVKDHVATWSEHPRYRDVTVQTDRTAPHVAAPPVALAQLLDNLLDNACKYSRPGSAIVVRVAKRADKALLEVEDHGMGMSPDEVKEAFAPFFRSPRARRDGIGGAGLGLAIVMRIATALGGVMRLQSQLSNGSTFTLEMPVCELPS